MNAEKNKKINASDKIPVKWSIFCDMDGTLIDTDYANYLAYRRALEIVTQGEYNIEFNPRERLNRESLQKRIPNLTDCQMKSIVYLKTIGHLYLLIFVLTRQARKPHSLVGNYQ